MKKFPKFRYKVVNKFGDLYYEEMPFDTAFERACSFVTDPNYLLKDQNEIDHYMRDNINKKLPLDGPQWRMRAQRMTDADGVEYTISIWKCHHSFMDGVSCISLTAAMSNEYSRDYFVKSKDATLLQRIMIRASVLYFIPKLLLETVFSFRDKNVITKGKR